MKSFRDLFTEWTEINPYDFQQTLIVMLGSALSSFGSLVDLPYTEISNEMFDIMINSVSSPRKRDNMRYLIMMLDRHLSETSENEVSHPSITDAQAVWMILNESASLKSNLIMELVQHISGGELPFEILGAKYLANLIETKSPDTIAYRRKSISLCSSLYGRPLSHISREEEDVILQSAPNWLHSIFKCTLKGISALDSACA